MSTTVATPTVATPPPAHLKVTQSRVLLSEWTKFRSLRSTMWTLAITVLLMIGLGALFSAVTANQYHTFTALDRARFGCVPARCCDPVPGPSGTGTSRIRVRSSPSSGGRPPPGPARLGRASG